MLRFKPIKCEQKMAPKLKISTFVRDLEVIETVFGNLRSEREALYKDAIIQLPTPKDTTTIIIMDNLILIAIFVVIITFLLKTTLFPSVSTMDIEKEIDPSKSTIEQQKNEPVVEKLFTPRTLYKYNGFDLEQIYIAVRGNVYDVSKGRQFYGPSGPYNNFAGHDASRGLAMNSFDAGMSLFLIAYHIDMMRSYGEPIDTLDDFTELEWKSLAAWEDTFKSKYPVVGKLVNEEGVGSTEEAKKDTKTAAPAPAVVVATTTPAPVMEKKEATAAAAAPSTHPAVEKE
ncbi:unnamed protein product [Ambrosiozyma monospora]|uniref:Unnamed protein product n=1 Tax=Ambrosiozyma monospora TaxID=43982 RepID=A0A9W6YKZ2_AMBMO|nr:unnamed protein product [Ambrosiozyma monospora]